MSDNSVTVCSALLEFWLVSFPSLTTIQEYIAAQSRTLMAMLHSKYMMKSSANECALINSNIQHFRPGNPWGIWLSVAWAREWGLWQEALTGWGIWTGRSSLSCRIHVFYLLIWTSFKVKRLVSWANGSKGKLDKNCAKVDLLKLYLLKV